MSAEEPGSITQWLGGLKEGRPEAVEAIWDRYYQRVLAAARRRLRGGPAQAVGEDEDVALIALHALIAGAARGQFERLENRADLWQILSAITARKAGHRRRWYERWKRAGRAADPAGAAGPGDGARPLDGAVSKEPAPEHIAMLGDQLEHFLEALGDPILRRIAEWRLEGASNAEIAAKLGRTIRTVERKVELIRLVWEQMDGDADRGAPAASGPSGGGDRPVPGKNGAADVASADGREG